MIQICLRRVALTGLLTLAVLSGCAKSGPVEKVTTTTTREENVTTVSETASRNAGQPTELRRLNGGAGGNAPQPLASIFAGSGDLYGATASGPKGATASTAGDISLNFVNADVKDVAKSVLGDLLGLNYLIDPAVQGAVTIETNQALARNDVLPAFETALRVNGFALINQRGLYSVVPFNGAAHYGAAAPGGPGYGTEIIPLRYVSPEQLRHVLEPIVPQGTIVEVDQARNIIVIGGSAGERAAIRENIATFDVDWMKGMSFALFRPRLATAKQLAEDLNHVMGDEGGSMAGQVRLIPLERMNAVLAIAPRAKLLEELRVWVARLDQGNETTDRRIFVYHVQNGRAGDLASVLGRALGVRTTSGPSPTPGRGGNFVSQGQSDTQSGGLFANRNSGMSGGALSGPLPGSPANVVQTPAPQLSRAAETPLANSGEGGDQSQPGVSITADEVNNALLVVATPAEYETIASALKELDILPLQVLIEASIAEVTLTNDLRFGVQWMFNGERNRATLSSAATGAVAPIFPGFSYVYSSGQRISAVLSALEDITHVDVLSSPKLMVLNNQTALLQVGDQVPVATQSAVSTETSGAPVVNSIEYRDTGVILTVTPRVNEGGLVLMDISQEVSNVSTTTTSNLDSPTISQRKIGSTVAVQDGQTIALGGLITNNRNDSRSGVPYLQNIPVLGHLFREDSKTDTRTELLVLITPRVIRDGRGAAAVTEELRGKLTNLKPYQ